MFLTFSSLFRVLGSWPPPCDVPSLPPGRYFAIHVPFCKGLSKGFSPDSFEKLNSRPVCRMPARGVHRQPPRHAGVHFQCPCSVTPPVTVPVPAALTLGLRAATGRDL
jgi:hypothetical protein